MDKVEVLQIAKKLKGTRITVNSPKKCFGGLCDPLTFTFDLSLAKGIFPDGLKINRVTPLFKGEDRSE